MTPIQACKETRDLWTKMARISIEEERVVEKWEVPGPQQEYADHYFCPCCEYASPDCADCPMLKEWRFYGKDTDAPCEDPMSPYKRWLDSIETRAALCIDVEFFFLLIAEMAEEALKRLEKD